MSKLTKLIKNPKLFFSDFLKKRLTDKEQAPTAEILAENVVFAFHFNDWKRSFFKDFLPEKEIIFVPFNIEKDSAKRRKWLNIFLKNPSTIFYVWGMNIPNFVKDLPNPKIFVEDGFIRSIGLGASHTLPFSLTLDGATPYFDSTKPSELESMLLNFDFQSNPDLIERAKRTIELIKETGISKYNNSKPINIDTIYGEKNRYRILVIGQVEDDASIAFGSQKKYTNNDLVTIARMEHPHAEIFYKPHPDVLARKRKELSNPKDVSNICKIITTDIPLAQAFQTIDHVYTITSQAGFEALMRGIKVTTLGAPFYSGWGLTDDRQKTNRRNRTLTLEELFLVSYIIYPSYINPFTKERIEIEDAINTLLSLREFDKNKDLLNGSTSNTASVENKSTIFAFHFNEWKRNFFRDIYPDKEIIFVPFGLEKDKIKEKYWSNILKKNPSAAFYIWGTNIPTFASKLPNPRFFVEDGFIRSLDLGANHVPPFSLTIDSKTPYFDSTKESDMENLIGNYNFTKTPELLVRSKKLIQKIIDTGISKYNHNRNIDLSSVYGQKERKRILVIGQVEDDASIKFGSKKRYTNNDLVTIARLENPDAEIFYKPHPDVIARKRKELSNPDDVKHLCTLLLIDIPLAQAFETIDHVYTITSQAGFEALLRGIKVTTLGAPFYSGWGLTDDRQKIERRNRKLKIEELFAIAYIVYPAYFNPFTKEKIEIEQAIDCLIDLKKLHNAAVTNDEDLSAVDLNQIVIEPESLQKNLSGHERIEAIRLIQESINTQLKQIELLIS